jgi:hypothetical protein
MSIFRSFPPLREVPTLQYEVSAKRVAAIFVHRGSVGSMEAQNGHRRQFEYAQKKQRAEILGAKKLPKVR